MTSENYETLFQSQHGEDKVLFDYFNQKKTGYYIEFGAFDGVHLSNTYFFEQIGWTGILAEPDPEIAERCRQARPKSLVFQCAIVAPGSPERLSFEKCENDGLYSSLAMDDAFRRKVTLWNQLDGAGSLKIKKIEVPARTLDSILEESNPPAIDFMTVDVETHEWEALQGFTISKWRPKVVIIESGTFTPDTRIFRYMCENGYKWDRSTTCNDWYISVSNKGLPFPVAAAVYAHCYIQRPLQRIVAAVGRRIQRVTKK